MVRKSGYRAQAIAVNAFALHDVTDQATARRWGASAFAIVAAHAALIALALNWYTQRPVPGVSLPAIMVDMAPVSSAPEPTQADLAPGPVMQQADASPPEPAAAEAVQEEIAPTPPQEKPEVIAPPEQKVEMKPATEPAKPVPEAKPTPVKPKVVRADAKKPTDAPPAPRTTASPKAERQAPPARPPRASAHRQRRWHPTDRWLRHICSDSSSTRRPPSPRDSRAPRASASRSAEAAECFRSA